MGFISFNEYYYRRKLEEYENGLLSDSDPEIALSRINTAFATAF